MKKILLLLLLPLFLLTSCEKEKTIDADDLPASANGFVDTHFPNEGITQVTRVWDDLRISYKVYLTNGARLDFNRQGDIIEMQCHSGLPDSVFPLLVLDYVRTHYPGVFIRGWERDHEIREVKLSNGLKLEFDKPGNFLRIDD